MRQTLTDDFWGLYKNMNCAFPLTSALTWGCFLNSSLKLTADQPNSRFKKKETCRIFFFLKIWSLSQSYFWFMSFCTNVPPFFIGFSAQKLKFSIKDLFIKCDQICSFMWSLSYLLKKSLIENFNFFTVIFCRMLQNIETKVSNDSK